MIVAGASSGATAHRVPCRVRRCQKIKRAPGHRDRTPFLTPDDPKAHSHVVPHGGHHNRAVTPAGYPACAPSHEVRCSSECFMRPDCRGVGFPCSRHGLGLSTGSSGFSPSAVPPETCAPGFILPRASRLLQSATPDCQPCAPPCDDVRAPPSGFQHSLIAASTTGVH